MRNCNVIRQTGDDLTQLLRNSNTQLTAFVTTLSLQLQQQLATDDDDDDDDDTGCLSSNH